MIKWVAVAFLVSLLACGGNLADYVRRSEIVTVLQLADEKLTAKFNQIDKTLKRLERQIKRRKSEENG